MTFFPRDVLAEPPPELVNDPSEISWHVPSHIKRKLGSAIIACSYQEHTTELVIWALLNLNADDGKLITARMEMSRRQAFLKELIPRYKKDDVPLPDEQFWEMMQTVIE